MMMPSTPRMSARLRLPARLTSVCAVAAVSSARLANDVRCVQRHVTCVTALRSARLKLQLHGEAVEVEEGEGAS